MKSKQYESDESAIRQLINDHVKAICEMDIEGTLSIYREDIVSFDLVPPLWYQGLEAKRKAWEDAFSTYNPPMGYEIRDLTIIVSGDMAFAHSLNRVSGILKNGNRSELWIRWTLCLQKINGNWLITHEQVSVPADLPNGRALLDLEP